MKALVIGFGSIGQRHARVLSELGCAVAVLSHRTVAFPKTFDRLGPALEDWQPDYVVIASRTSEHRGDLAALVDAGFEGRVLIEKPLFDDVQPVPRHRFRLAAVAYNLRFHPCIVRLRAVLQEEGAVSAAHVYVGQHLSQWRPGTDYRQSYSAHREQGGGVLRDLSHDIDYALHLFGTWLRLTALGGHVSPLDIDSDDVYSLLFELERCAIASIQMNYLDRTPRREIVVHGARHTVRVDMIKGRFEVDGVAEQIAVDRDFTYKAEHHAMLSADDSALCTLEEASEIMSTIAAAERASARHEWITR